MTLKKEHYLFALIGVGTVIVLYVLYRESQAAAPAAEDVAPVVPSSVPQYPAPAPIQLGNVTLQETPPYQNYNLSGPLPTVKVGNSHSDCGCDDTDCDTAGLPVTIQTIPDDVLTSVVKNYHSFITKTAA